MSNEHVPAGSNRPPTFSSVDCELIQLDSADLKPGGEPSEAHRAFIRRCGEEYRRLLAERRERDQTDGAASSEDCVLIQLDSEELDKSPPSEAVQAQIRRMGEEYRRMVAEQREREEKNGPPDNS